MPPLLDAVPRCRGLCADVGDDEVPDGESDVALPGDCDHLLRLRHRAQVIAGDRAVPCPELCQQALPRPCEPAVLGCLAAGCLTPGVVLRDRGEQLLPVPGLERCLHDAEVDGHAQLPALLRRLLRDAVRLLLLNQRHVPWYVLYRDVGAGLLLRFDQLLPGALLEDALL